MTTREFTVKQSSDFRLRIKKSPCLKPKGLNSIEFVQECLDSNGSVNFSSTYQFFMSDQELKTLSEELAK